MVIMDAVYRETIMLPGRKTIIDNFLRENGMTTISISPVDINVNMEFALIKRLHPLIGDGERTLMAHARFNDEIIASSNFRDIAVYCEENKIDFLGTLDLLAIGLKKRIISAAQCHKFMEEAINKNHARFPAGITDITKYNCTKLEMLD